MYVKYPPRTQRGIRGSAGAAWIPNRPDQHSEVAVFQARDVRVFAARRSAGSFAWVEVELPPWVLDPQTPVLLVARRPPR